jgi:glycosyltransferase involved in cell wall biosynthesis
MQKRPEVSVVIPTLNEEKYVGRVLESLSKQTFKNFEVIISDCESCDDTRKIAKRFPKVNVVIERKKGISAGRNAGARSAKGKILVFLDADTMTTNKLLEIYDRAFRDSKGTVAATGPIFPLEKTSKRMNLGFRIVSILFVKFSILIGRPSVVGSNFAVRKSAFDRIGGFNESFVTYEDYDLSLRLRKQGTIRYLDDAVVRASVRRVKAWGILGYFIYHTGNIIRYSLTKKPKEVYDPVR